MSFSERRYEYQGAGAPIFAIRTTPWQAYTLWCPSSKISGHSVACYLIIGISPFEHINLFNQDVKSRF
jgi:hypothetical protein